MTRVKGWEHAYENYLTSAARLKFKYGTFDCCLFVANAIQAITGVDVAAEMRGTYVTAAQAAVKIQSLTGVGDDVPTIATYLFNKHGVTVNANKFMCKRGDPVLIQNGTTLGIVSLDGAYVLGVTEQGFTRVSITNVVKSWSLDA